MPLGRPRGETAALVMREPSPESSARRLLSILLLVVAFVAYPSIDREIYFYDEGVYLVSSKSLASGLGYRNENLPDSPPQGLYPPLLPLLLGAAWRLYPDFPANLLMMKFLMLMMALGFLASAYRCLTNVLRMRALDSVAVVAMVGLNPLFLAFATRLSSEMLFALLSILAINFYRAFHINGSAVDLGVCALFSSLAFLTRSIGVALLLAGVITLLRQRRHRAVVAFSAIAALTAIPWFAWSWLARSAYDAYPGEIAANYRGYVVNILLTDWLGQINRSLPTNLLSLMVGWASILFPWGPPVMGLLMTVALCVLSRRLLRQLHFHDLYCGFSLLLILLWPWPVNSRFLIAISPFLLSYFFLPLSPSALEAVLSPGWAHKTSRFLIAAILILALGHDLLSIQVLREQRLTTSDVYPEFHRMLEWIRDNTTPNAILVGASDPVYYLFTHRRTIRLSYPDPFSIYYRQEVLTDFPHAGRLLAWFRQMNACYVLQDPMIGGREHLYYRSLIDAMRNTSPKSLAPVYQGQGGSFVVYRIDGCHDRPQAIWRS
jgi:hypothetical protein